MIAATAQIEGPDKTTIIVVHKDKAKVAEATTAHPSNKRRVRQDLRRELRSRRTHHRFRVLRRRKAPQMKEAVTDAHAKKGQKA